MSPCSVLSFGGGVNSTAMLLLLLERGERPDLVLFADTGGERPETYHFIAILNAWLGRMGRNLEITVVSNAGRGQGDSLEENCIRRKELPSLAYGFKGCSVKWKRQPMDRYIRDEWAPAKACWDAGGKVTRYIGIDAGETRRKKLPPDARYVYSYPLVEEGIDREGCIALIESSGLPVPPKSSCFFCPAMRKPEVLDLAREYPDLMQRALFMESNAVTHTIKGLGRHWSWRELLQGQSANDAPTAAPCDCMDESEE